MLTSISVNSCTNRDAALDGTQVSTLTEQLQVRMDRQEKELLKNLQDLTESTDLHREYLDLKHKVLGRTNLLLSFDTTQIAYKRTRLTVLLLLHLYSLTR
jgi:RNA binding exosome subunit